MDKANKKDSSGLTSTQIAWVVKDVEKSFFLRNAWDYQF